MEAKKKQKEFQNGRVPAYNECMVSLDLLKKSQISRPRKPVVALGIISVWFIMIPTLLYIWLLVPNSALFNEWAVHGSINPALSLSVFMTQVGFPLIIVGVGCFHLALISFMAKCRKAYGWLATPCWALFVLLMIGGILIYAVAFVPGFAAFLAKFMNIEELFARANPIFLYGVAVYGGFLFLGSIFAMLYNTNYPAKYEEIYARRKARLRAYPNYLDQQAYRVRFYENYRDGNWYQMMMDLYFKELSDPKAEIDEGLLQFMCEYAGYNDGHVRASILQEYHRRGDDKKTRELFFRYLHMRESLQNGGHLILPGDRTPVPAKKKPVRTGPAPYVPPLAPLTPKRQADENATDWSPDDIY